jgi:hypothetical protein
MPESLKDSQCSCEYGSTTTEELLQIIQLLGNIDSAGMPIPFIDGSAPTASHMLTASSRSTTSSPI